MKILYLTETNIGGGAKSTLNIAKVLSNYSKVSIFGIEPLSNDNINVYKCKASNPVSVKYVVELINFIRIDKPSIVHASGMYTAMLALFVKWLLKKDYALILTLRHTSRNFRLHFISKRFVSILNNVNLVHYLSDYQRSLYYKFGLRPTNYKIIPNIAFVQHYSQSHVNEFRCTISNSLDSDFIMLYAGRIVESKQIEMILNVVASVRNKGIRLSALILGKGSDSYLKRLSLIMKESGITNYISFMGHVTNPEFFIKVCDFAFFPTMWDEAYPRFIVEAFSNCKTMITSNHPSITGIVKDRVNVLMAHENTIKDYTELCLEIITNDNLRKNLEQNALKFYNENLSLEVLTSEYIEMYECAIKRSVK